MHKFISNYIKGVTVSTVVLPAGTIMTDETNGNLFVHDGVTAGGNLLVIGSKTSQAAAAGTTQANATPLTARVTIITSASAGTGVVVALVGSPIKVLNRSGTPFLVYPPSTGQFEAYGANNPMILPDNEDVEVVMISPTQGYTF